MQDEMMDDIDIDIDIDVDSELVFNLNDKNEQAKLEIITELRNKYGSKINSERNRTEKEMRFVDSMEDKTLTIARKVVEEHNSKINQDDYVSIRVDRKTIVRVHKSKCIQNPDGNWIRK